MELGRYLKASGRSLNDVHCASRVNYGTLLAIVNEGYLLRRVDVAQRLVDACEGQVKLKDVLHPDALKVALSIGNHAPSDPQPTRPKVREVVIADVSVTGSFDDEATP